MLEWQWYLGCTLLALIAQGFFSMVEIACVSCDRVWLHYWISKGDQRAKWLGDLLQNSTILFGITLLGVTAAIQVGSECSRRFYDSLGYSPSLALATQIFVVLFFAELAPMFAGWQYAEYVARRAAPLLYFLSIVLRPLVWVLNLFSGQVFYSDKSASEGKTYLSREDLEYLFVSSDVLSSIEGSKAVSRILRLNKQSALDYVLPLNSFSGFIPRSGTKAQLRQSLEKNFLSFLLVFDKSPEDIIGVIYPQDLLQAPEDAPIFPYVQNPWIVSQHTPILDALRGFYRNQQALAFVLSDKRKVVGVLTQEAVVDDVLGSGGSWREAVGESGGVNHLVMVDKVFPGETKITEIGYELKISWGVLGAVTLEEIFEQKLGRPPEKGDQIYADPLCLTVVDVSLGGQSFIQLTSLY